MVKWKTKISARTSQAGHNRRTITKFHLWSRRRGETSPTILERLNLQLNFCVGWCREKERALALEACFPMGSWGLSQATFFMTWLLRSVRLVFVCKFACDGRLPETVLGVAASLHESEEKRLDSLKSKPSGGKLVMLKRSGLSRGHCCACSMLKRTAIMIFGPSCNIWGVLSFRI